MKSTGRTNVPFRRKRKGLTNYKKRIALIKSGRIRFVVRKSNKNTIIQCVEYAPEGDRVLFTANSQELKKMGWKANNGNIPSAYLTGCLAGVKAKKMNINNAVVDFGLQMSTKGSRLYAAVKGVLRAGLVVPVDPEVLPSEESVNGKYSAKTSPTVADIEKEMGL